MRLENNVFGLKAQGPAVVTVTRSLAANNAQAGFAAPVAGTTLELEASVATHNGTGVDCGLGNVRLGLMRIADNGTALRTSANCFTFKNNAVDATITATAITLQKRCWSHGEWSARRRILRTSHVALD